MKPGPLILVVSLVANAALAFVYWQRSAAASAESKPLAAANPVANAPAMSAADDVAAALRDHPEFVAAVQSRDPKRIHEALTRAGFPDAYVRDMITFDVNNSLTPEKLALLRHQAEKPFWQTGLGDEGRALQKSLAELDAKNNAIAKDVFGGRIPPHPLEAQNQQRRYRFLPADKAEQVARIDRDYSELRMQVRRGADAARDKLQLLREEKRADLAKVLTPQELELYDLTLSPTAETMRRSLGLFQPTEAEFRAVFELRRPFDEKHADSYASKDQALMKQRIAEQEALNNQVRARLGEQRYRDYERAQDHGYRTAVEIAKHFKLPEAAAMETYTLQQTAMEQARQIVRAAGDDRAASAAQISSLVEDTNRRLEQLLGAPGADAYKKTAGSWLTSLQRPGR